MRNVIDVANFKLRTYYNQTQNALSCIYDKTTLLQLSAENQIFKEAA